MPINFYRARLGHRRAYRLSTSEHKIRFRAPSRRQLEVMRDCVFTDSSLGSQKRFFGAIGLQPGDTIIDVGANIGSYSLLYTIVAPSSPVIALEPSNVNFRYFQGNCADYAMVRGYNIGAHDTPAQGSLCMPSVAQYDRVANMNDNSGLLSLYGNSHRAEEEVKLRPLDDLLDSGLITSPVGFIKIDVEGNEFQVLRGASRIIERYAPAIEVEINPPLLKLADNNYEDIREFLGERDYHPHRFDGENLLPIGAQRVDKLLDVVFVGKGDHLRQSSDLPVD